MDFALLSSDGLMFIFRWLHFFFGIIWIGLLYYFNYVQTPFMAEADAATKPGVVQKLVPRALWWFRWGAMGTLVTGLLILGMRGHQLGGAFMSSSYGHAILTGAILAILMWFNVWFVIWPNQKIVIASSQQVTGGGQAIPEAAGAAARAGVASRTNVLFSIPMLFFMGAPSHLGIAMSEDSKTAVYWLLFAIIALVIEGNALKGKMVKPLATVKGVIHSGFALAVVIYVLMEVLF